MEIRMRTLASWKILIRASFQLRILRNGIDPRPSNCEKITEKIELIKIKWSFYHKTAIKKIFFIIIIAPKNI